MWNFIKNVFAVITGLFLFSILSIIGLVFIIAIASSSDEINNTTTPSVLKIKLDKEIVERESEQLFSGFSIIPSGSVIGLLDLKEAISQAKTNDNIKGIYLDLSSIQAGFASLEEIRSSLIEFKSSGKFIIAYGEYFSEGAYYLASVADKIILPPSGSLEFNGLESEILFFKGSLEKLDLKVEVFKVGSFKSAVEPFIQDKMSDSNKLQVKSFMNSIYTTYLTNISKSREITFEKLKSISDSLLIRNANDALRYGLISDVAYYNSVEDYIKTKSNLTTSDKINFIDYTKLINNQTAKTSVSNNKIAVIIANGEIVSGKGNDETIGSESLSAQIKKAREDDDIKAIVLRINSPGGSALASDVIWNEVVLTKGTKPIIASMSDVAASGGYYIAMACDSIVAQPNTITGSIGVFGLMVNAENFLKNKLGITSDRVTTGKFSDIGSSTRTLTNFERSVIQKEVENIYEDFTNKAAKGRKISQNELKKYAEGRVWSGVEALNCHLVDTLGGISEAINMARTKANLAENDYEIIYLPEQKNMYWKQLLADFENESNYESILKKELGFIYPYYNTTRNIDKLNGIQARMPFNVIIK